MLLNLLLIKLYPVNTMKLLLLKIFLIKRLMI